MNTVASQSSPGTPQGHLSPRYSLYPQMDLTHKATHNAATWPLLLTPFQGCWDPFQRIESHQSLASLQSDNGPAFVSQIIQVSEVTFKFYSAYFKSLERNNKKKVYSIVKQRAILWVLARLVQTRACKKPFLDSFVSCSFEIMCDRLALLHSVSPVKPHLWEIIFPF